MKPELKIELVKTLIETLAPKSMYFTVTFIKADKTVRVMNCQRGVKVHLKGGKSTIAKKENLISVYDTGKKAYRCINALTVTQIKAGGEVISLKEATS